MMGCSRIDLTGQVFGRLTVQGPSMWRDNNREILWLCRCSCGKRCFVRVSNLRSGSTKSCGCLKVGRKRKGRLC